jgi:hypothetical protein
MPVQVPGTLDAAVLSPLKSFILARDLGLDELSAGLSFDSMLNVLFNAFLDAGSQTVKAAATKAIASIAHIDPDMLGHDDFRRLITTTLSDPSIGVRCNIVEALGNCFASTTSLASADKYVPHLLAKLGDPGVSVRKAVVRILHLLLMRRRRHEHRVAILKQLILRYQRLEAEDSVKAVILDCISQLWFHQKVKRGSGSGSGSGGGGVGALQTQAEFLEPILAKVCWFVGGLCACCGSCGPSVGREGAMG